jgi:hypothetical protein
MYGRLYIQDFEGSPSPSKNTKIVQRTVQENSLIEAVFIREVLPCEFHDVVQSH